MLITELIGVGAGVAAGAGVVTSATEATGLAAVRLVVLAVGVRLGLVTRCFVAASAEPAKATVRASAARPVRCKKVMVTPREIGSPGATVSALGPPGSGRAQQPRYRRAPTGAGVRGRAGPAASEGRRWLRRACRPGGSKPPTRTTASPAPG